jgi:2-polyprenyl-3-methyl-5-hydroxy-6-metoxy-1,4-benzoquinol methylase
MASREQTPLPAFEIPENLRRSPRPGKNYLAAATGLIGWMAGELGVPDLSGKSVLDIGCGVNFTEALYGHGVPVKRYHGVDVSKPIIAFLRKAVKDARFSFCFLDVNNARYRKVSTVKLSAETDIGAAGEKFDIVCLFSVFTHLDPADYGAMLELCRRHIRDNGTLFFTSFLNNDIDGDFVDRDPEHPLLMAIYREDAARRYAANAGWKVEKVYPASQPRQSRIVCTPV